MTSWDDSMSFSGVRPDNDPDYKPHDCFNCGHDDLIPEKDFLRCPICDERYMKPPEADGSPLATKTGNSV